MARKKHTWPRDSEIILITEIRERPQLWDLSHPDYAKVHKKSAQWEEIAEKLGTCFNATMVKDRFENMRTTFQRNLNKVKDSMRSGKGTDEIFQPTWDLYPYLTFLKKSCIQANSTSNLDIGNDYVDSQVMTHNTTELSAIIFEEDRDVYFDETLQQWLLIPNDNQRNQSSENCSSDNNQNTAFLAQQCSKSPIH